MAEFNGKQGKWITTKTGKHIFIENGQSIEEAMADAFGEEYTFDDDTDFDIDNTFTDAHGPEGLFDSSDSSEDIKKLEEDKIKEDNLKNFKGIWDAPYAYIKNAFKDQYMKHKIVDGNLESVLFKNLKNRNKIQKVWFNYKLRDGSYYNRYIKNLSIEIKSNPYYTVGILFHEMGHCLDSNEKGGYHSSSYISKKYNMTLADMVKEELLNCDIEGLIGEYESLGKLNDSNWSAYFDGAITSDERNYYKAKVYYSAYLSVCDIIQSVYGLEYTKEKLGNWTHNPGYFDWKSDKYPEEAEKHNRTNRGAEVFAEITEDLVNNDEHHLTKILKKYAPKTLEIYHEILKEEFGYEK